MVYRRRPPLFRNKKRETFVLRKIVPAKFVPAKFVIAKFVPARFAPVKFVPFQPLNRGMRPVWQPQTHDDAKTSTDPDATNDKVQRQHEDLIWLNKYPDQLVLPWGNVNG